MFKNIEAYQRQSKEIRSEIQEAGRFSDQMMECLESDGEEYYPTEPGVFSASSLGWSTGKSLCGKYVIGCQRLLGYRYIGVPQIRNTPPRDRFRMDVGTAIHGVIEGYLHKLSATTFYPFSDYEDEVWVDGSLGGAAAAFDIRSRTDGIYRVHYNPYVLEVKTLASDAFNKLRSPKPEHLTQLMVYLACLDIPVGNMLYIGMAASLPRKEFMVEFDPAHWQAIADKIDYVKDGFTTVGELPREGNAYVCRRCSYKYVCQPTTKVTNRLDSRKVKL